MDRKTICKFYFELGLDYTQILAFLANVYGIFISMRTLKRILRSAGLCRRKNYTDIVEAAIFIEETMQSTGFQQGYRWVHLQCRQNGINIPRENVAILMKILDPNGVEMPLRKRLRRRQYYAKGPDFLWHLDSYDKLKRYGLCINGCIDGFSRHIMWLNAYKSSSDPRIIGGYYMETVSTRRGCPSIMRGDQGTEKEFFTNKSSFIYERSTGNQRIEMFWNFLRRQCGQFWIEALGVIADEGIFGGGFLDKKSYPVLLHKQTSGMLKLLYVNIMWDVETGGLKDEHGQCYIYVPNKVCGGIKGKDLDDMVHVWNAHNIRATKNRNSPHGRPIVMYMIPASYNTRSYLVDVDQDQIETCNRECSFRDHYVCDEAVYELSLMYIEENAWTRDATTIEECLTLYMQLRDAFHADLNI